MLKQISILILLSASVVCTSAQTENREAVAPVKWERYRVAEREVSALFPKLPVVIDDSSACNEESRTRYAAYAEGIAYGLNIGYRNIQSFSEYGCVEAKLFGTHSFNDRLNAIKAQLKTNEETKIVFNGYSAIKIKGNFYTYWLINDYDNKRWFELYVTEEQEDSTNIKNFVSSFKIEKNTAGWEIGKGADRTIGDESVPAVKNVSETKGLNEGKVQTEDLTPLRLVLKPRPNYTAEARKKSIKGTVILKVTFSANGGIGNVEAVKSLSHGLTDSAIGAASKIVFIPAKKNGVNIAVTRVVEYSFIIY